MDIINPANRSAAVNTLILYDLAKRAERHGDPYENLEAMYHLAEMSWARATTALSNRQRGGDATEATRRARLLTPD
jgi:hypothetical protein